MGSSALTGGRVNYYLATVKFPQREEQLAYTAECEDIIQALQMDFNEACEFKAIWRTAAARLGNGKPGQKALYDAEKRLHYAGRSVAELRRAESPPVVEPELFSLEAQGWIPHTTTAMPIELDKTEPTQVLSANGYVSEIGPAQQWAWNQRVRSLHGITHWRKA